MKARPLEQRELGAIHHEVPIHPLWTNLLSHPFLCALLLFGCGKMDELVVQGEQGNHDTVRRVDNRARPNACPMSNSFGTCRITIMPGTIHEDGELSFDWNLWAVRVVVEDMVVAYLLKDTIESGWVHANLPSELVEIPIAPRREKMDLRMFGDLRFRRQNLSIGYFLSKPLYLLLDFQVIVFHDLGSVTITDSLTRLGTRLILTLYEIAPNRTWGSTYVYSYLLSRSSDVLGSCTVHRALLIDGNASTAFWAFAPYIELFTPVLYTVLYIDATEVPIVYKVASLR